MENEIGYHSSQLFLFGVIPGEAVLPFRFNVTFFFLILLGLLLLTRMEIWFGNKWKMIGAGGQDPNLRFLGLKFWNRGKEKPGIKEIILDEEESRSCYEELEEKLEALRIENESNRLALRFRQEQLVKLMELVGKIEGNKEIVLSMSTLVNKDRDERFLSYLDQVVTISNSPLIRKISLKFPGITKSELELCYWLYLGLDTKGISNLTFRSPGSVKVQRSRLRKKLGIRDLSQSLVSFLDQVDREG